MSKKIETTIDKYIKALSPQQKKVYDQGREAFAIQEMFYAAMENDYESVQELAKMIGIPPNIIDDIVDPSSFYKALNHIGYNIVLEKKDSRISLANSE